MSGSGPTVFAIARSIAQAQSIADSSRDFNAKIFVTRTN